MSDEFILHHQSGVNQKGEPFVQLLLSGKIVGQFTPGECRDHAHAMLETAEAAEQDAFMLEFMQKELGQDLDCAMGVLRAFRRWRERTGKKGPPSDRNEFIVADKHRKTEGDENR